MTRKNNLLFLDTETTGFGEFARLVQVAYKYTGEEGTVQHQLFKPSGKGYDGSDTNRITASASAVNHITNKMVADKPYFKDSEMHEELNDLMKNPETIFVAHNAPFDLDFLHRDGIQIDKCKVIDTKNVAKALLTDIKKHNLQYLRYKLELEDWFEENKMEDLSEDDFMNYVVGKQAVAHSAEGDVMVMMYLFDYLFDEVKARTSMSDEEIISWMISKS